MGFIYNTSKTQTSPPNVFSNPSEMINFPIWKLFSGDAGKDPFFELRMKASVIAMAKFLDFLDQTETYKYYPLGLKVKDALYYDSYREEHKNIVTQLATHSYFFEKETLHSKTIFNDKEWVRATLNELDLWPIQYEIHYECFTRPPNSSSAEPLYRRIEVSKAMQIYSQKLEKFSFNEENEWSHLWNLIIKEYSD